MSNLGCFTEDIESILKKFVYKDRVILSDVENNDVLLKKVSDILVVNSDYQSEEFVFYSAYYDYFCFKNECLKINSDFSFVRFLECFKSSSFKFKKILKKHNTKKNNKIMNDLNKKFIYFSYIYDRNVFENVENDFFVIFNKYERSFYALLKFKKENEFLNNEDQANFKCEFIAVIYDFLYKNIECNDIRLLVYFLIKLKKYVFKLIKLVGVNDVRFVNNLNLFMDLEEVFFKKYYEIAKKSQDVLKADEIRYIKALPFNIDKNRKSK